MLVNLKSNSEFQFHRIYKSMLKKLLSCYFPFWLSLLNEMVCHFPVSLFEETRNQLNKNGQPQNNSKTIYDVSAIFMMSCFRTAKIRSFSNKGQDTFILYLNYTHVLNNICRIYINPAMVVSSVNMDRNVRGWTESSPPLCFELEPADVDEAD